jgi:DNA repair protein RadC
VGQLLRNQDLQEDFMTMYVMCDSAGGLKQHGATDDEVRTVRCALGILERCLARTTPLLSSPGSVRDYLRLRVGSLQAEVFGMIWLDTQHRVLATEELFRGSLTQTSVYPREVVRRGLQLNAAAAVAYHNHPSGMAEPSRADEFLTRSIQSAFGLVAITLLDHFVVGHSSVVSFAERGLM